MTTHSEAGAGFAAQAARLVEAARANERAVRDLEEATQILAASMEDVSAFDATAEALRELGSQVENARASATSLEEATAGLDEAQALMEAALAQARALEERVGTLADRFDTLDETLGHLEESLSRAGERAERIDAIERKLDQLIEVWTRDADVYVARVGPQLARLEAVAERMDAPALADELADVLAAAQRVLEVVDEAEPRDA